MPIQQFKLEFSKTKLEMCRNGKKAVCLFDKERDVGVAVSQHDGKDDDEGERVDMEPRVGGVFAYKVHDGLLIVVRLGLQKDGTAKKLLHAVHVLANGVEEAHPPFDILPGEKYQLPNLEMDPNEGPNYWIIKENDEIVLTIMIHV